MPYRTLDPDRIITTADRLEQRIGERFLDSGLHKVAAEIAVLARDCRDHALRLHRPVWWLRILILVGIAAGGAVFALVGTLISFDRLSGDGLSLVQGIEAAINTLVLAGLGFFTLIQLEERFKRHAAFKGLHGLRSVIHIIDMHQLTKDPGTLQDSFTPTKSSPARGFTKAELRRYLDYCSEMLSVTGKLAALYAQAVNDDVVIGAVNDIEALGTNLARKIWQKIMLIG
jgi:hypothetical protein